MASLLQIQRSKLKKQQSDNKIPNNRTRRYQGRIQYWNAKTKKWQNTKAPSLKTNTSTTKSSTKRLPPGRTTLEGKPSARRADAAARQVRAAQGTTSPTVRTGQPSRGYKAAQAAGSRALRRTALRSARKPGVAGLVMGAVTAAGAAGLLGNKVKKSLARDEKNMQELVRNPLKKQVKPTSGLTKNQQETLSKQNAANRLRKNEQARARKVGNPTAETRAIYNKAAEKQSGGKVTGSTSKTTVTKAPKRDRMEGKSSSERLKAWALANKKMIRKSGTKKQKAILNKALNLGANDLKRYSTSA